MRESAMITEVTTPAEAGAPEEASELAAHAAPFPLMPGETTPSRSAA